jgi:hypothetical protein
MSEASRVSSPLEQPRPERRGELRFPLRLAVTVLSSPAREIGESRDIGFRGIFVVSERVWPRRTLLRLGLILPTTGAELIVHAVVARVVPPGNARGLEPGMGLELFATDRTVRALWSGLVRHAHDHAAPALDDLRDEPSGVRVSPAPCGRRARP